MQAPNLTMIILNDETKRYCATEPKTGDLQPTQQSGDWFKFEVPISAFNCDSTADKIRLEFQNPNERNA